jgi:hypothetical protein
MLNSACLVLHCTGMSSENPESLPPEEKATNPVAPIVAPTDPEPPRPHRITWVLATGGVVVSIISAVLSYLALVTNRESILASNRAYIVVTDAYSIDDFKLDTLGDPRIDLRNEGKTPAHSVLLTSNITVTDTELPDFNDLRSYKSDYESSLGPNGASSKPQTLEACERKCQM